MPGSSSASPATGHTCSPSNAHAWYPGTNSPSPGPETLRSISRAEPPEIFVFLFQLDHLELTSDGQPLELLELRHPVQLIESLLDQLCLCPVLLGDVPGGGEHPQDFPAAITVDRRVVQHLGQRPVPVAHRQRVVDGHALLEDQLVDRLTARIRRSFTGTLMLTAECRASAHLLPIGRSEATPQLPGSG